MHGFGWRYFAGTVLGVAGVMRIFDGIWALHYHGVVPDHLENAVFGDNLKNYGWLWLILGIVLVAVSLFVVVSVKVATPISRWLGVVAGAVLSISAVWWMPYYPVWSLVYIGLGIAVIYALVAHGTQAEMEAERQASAI